jgi:glycosyltransferase involved in cell wall biosynthesis
MSPPLVSIVIPAYNAAPWLQTTLASVQAQSMTRWELIVINDGSTDATLEIAAAAASLDKRLRVVSQANGGLCAARNAGFAASNDAAPFVAFLDADDLWESNCLDILLQALSDDPAALAAYGLARAINATGEFIRVGELESYHRERWGVREGRIQRWNETEPTTFGIFALGDRITSVGCVLLRRTALQEVGNFAETLPSWEDWDLWLRICMRGSMRLVNQPVLRYRKHGNNMSSDHRMVAAAYHQLRRRLKKLVPPNSEFAALATQGERLHRKFHAQRFWRQASQHWQGHRWIHAVKDLARSAREFTRYLLHA